MQKTSASLLHPARERVDAVAAVRRRRAVETVFESGDPCFQVPTRASMPFGLQRQAPAVEKRLANLVGGGVADPIVPSDLFQAAIALDELERERKLLLES